MGYCRGGGMDNDIGVYTSLAVVFGLLRRRCLSPSVRPRSVVCVCVVVSWFFSIPLLRRWRPMRAWVWIGCLVTCASLVLACCTCRTFFRAPNIPLALLACACLFGVACTHTMLLGAVLAASSCVSVFSLLHSVSVPV